MTNTDNISILNDLGRKKEPFLFLIDFKGVTLNIFSTDVSPDVFMWNINGQGNYNFRGSKLVLSQWEIHPVSFEQYKKGFDIVKKHIAEGDTYLLNYTQPTRVKTNLSPAELFQISSAPYKICLGSKFVCFSPEPFVKINNGKIWSFPMKGTIDAGIEGAEKKVLLDEKEKAEHYTIVDLIRNDLSLVAQNVNVDKFRYITHIQTNSHNLLQVSSQISGELPHDYHCKIGDILYSLLPAGSISGAPKKKTVEIIEKAEGYERGFYTGIFGWFDGTNLDSCVLIRFIENDKGNLCFKSGGGITFMSDARNEYDEMLKKVYVPTF